jgi:hypothetical protein
VSTPDIRGALQSRLTGTPGLPAARAREGVTFQPTTGVAYVADTLVLSSKRMRALGGEATTKGSYEVAVLYPSGKGTLEIETVVDAVLEQFKPPLTLALAGSGKPRVEIRYAERRGAAQIDASWIRVHVSIGFYVFN